MIQIDVDIDVQDRIGSKAKRGVEKYLLDGAQQGKNRAMEEVPEDRGNLRLSMAEFVPEVRDGDVVWGVGDQPHALIQNSGHEPYTPPVRPLLEWADRTFGKQTDPTTEEVLNRINNDEWGPDLFNHGGMAVWSKIRSEGIEGTGYLTKGAEVQKEWYKSHDPSEYIEKQLK